jgi:hypothetical protein
MSYILGTCLSEKKRNSLENLYFEFEGKPSRNDRDSPGGLAAQGVIELKGIQS